MLGEAFHKQFGEDYILRCTDIDVNEDWLSLMDFRDIDAYRKDVSEFSPDLLFHLGAYTDLEFCERNADETYLTNTLSVENAVYIANHLDIPLLYISTAGIFNGNEERYDDWHQPSPLGVYARSKYMGERFVIENAKRYLICRAGWMMGAGPKKDKKFIQKLMLQIKCGKKDLFIVNDRQGTPTYTQDFAKTVKRLVEKEYWGLYNCVCSGETNRLAVAEELLRITGMQSTVRIHQVNSCHFKQEYFAPRPCSEILSTRKLDLRGANLMRPWKVSLQEYIQNYYQGYLE